MRQATWLKVEPSPVWHDLYRQYRRRPPAIRAPLQVLATPQWHLAAYLVRAASCNRVVAGPFRGMRLRLSDLSSRHLHGYILGSQELELREAIERIAERRDRNIVNVGAADGYNNVGLGLRSPTSRVEAFEALPELPPVIERSARLNGVSDPLAVFGACDPERCAPACGAPLELAEADILVETYDAFVRNVTDTLIERFWQTHHVERYTAQPCTLTESPPGFLPVLPRWFPSLAVDLVDERRTGIQRWLYLTAKEW